MGAGGAPGGVHPGGDSRGLEGAIGPLGFEGGKAEESGSRGQEPGSRGQEPRCSTAGHGAAPAQR